jgi:phage terminase small subunit
MAIRTLTPKQQLFCLEYIVDLNATQAAIRAGYRPHRAHVTGSKLASISLVRAEINRLMAERRERTEVNADQVIRELSRIAFADIGDICQWGEEGVILKKSETLPPLVRGAVAEVSQGQFGVKVKMHSKTDALSKLAQHLGLLIDAKVIAEMQKQLKELADGRTASA